MPNITEIKRATSLLVARPDLSVVDPLDEFLGEEPTPDKLTEAALALRQPDVLLPIISALIEDPTGTELEATPARMIVNFDADGNRVESLHAVPLAQGNGWSSRLHVWHEGQNLTEDNHTHTADFGSAVLVGSFIDQVLTPAPFGEGHRMFRYINDGRTEPVGEVTLRPNESRIIPAGSFHTMDHRAIHTANVTPDGITATLVVRRARTDSGMAFTEGQRMGSPPWMERVDAKETLTRLRTALKKP